MSLKALILSATAGAGHVRAGEALARACREFEPGIDVRHEDTLAFTNRVFRRLYADAYLDLVRWSPTMFGWLYEKTDKPWKTRRVTAAINKLNTRPFVRMIRSLQPDVAVCTHFLPVEILCRLKKRGVYNGPIVTVVTDLDVHAFWLVEGVDHYFVALEESAEHLRQLGVPAARITVSGIPIDPLFSLPKDRSALRVKHGLDPKLRTLLVSTGGFGVGNVELLVSCLRKISQPVQLVVICGKNEELKSHLENAMAGSAGHPVQVLGFTREMHDLMAVSDLLIGKPGGLTTSEALASGLPLCIVNPIPGQEERNSDHLLEEGAAIRCNNLPTIPWKIDQLLQDPARLERMRENVRRMAKPAAARRIITALQRLPG